MRLPLSVVVALLHIISAIVGVYPTVDALSSNESFTPSQFSNGSAVCTDDTPAFALSLADVDAAFPAVQVASLTGAVRIPGSVRCAYYCTALATSGGGDDVVAGCVGFNYWSDVNGEARCEFYPRTPANCVVRAGCSYYSVGWTRARFA